MLAEGKRQKRNRDCKQGRLPKMIRQFAEHIQSRPLLLSANGCAVLTGYSETDPTTL
jgi:hypothetical protein